MEPKEAYEPKRFYRRVPLGIYAKAKTNSFLLPFNYTNNISLGGLFITTGSRAPVEFQISKGSQVTLQFMLPNSAEISEIDGEIIWTDTCIDLNNNYLTYGVGLKFVKMAKKTEKFLMHIVGYPETESH
jgi:hypothetical protein